MKNKILNTSVVGRKVFSKHFLSAACSEIGFAGTGVNTILTNEQSLRDFSSHKVLIYQRALSV